MPPICATASLGGCIARPETDVCARVSVHMGNAVGTVALDDHARTGRLRGGQLPGRNPEGCGLERLAEVRRGDVGRQGDEAVVETVLIGEAWGRSVGGLKGSEAQGVDRRALAARENVAHAPEVRLSGGPGKGPGCRGQPRPDHHGRP